MEEKVFQLESDGRRLDVQLSEAAGISRSRAAALMEEGYCLLEGEPPYPRRRTPRRRQRIFRWKSCMRTETWRWL